MTPSLCLTPSQQGTQGWSQKYLSPTQEGLPSTPGGGVGVEGGDLEEAAVSLSGWGGGRMVELGKSEGGRGCKGSVGR